jgi:hypothetical protein
MPVTMEDVRAALDPEEPNYPKAARLGPEALPHLKELVNSGDAMLASKAAYLASLIADEGATDVVEHAARRSEPIVRVAAAAAAANLAGAAGERVLRSLATDTDPGVRKVARERGARGVGPAREAPTAPATGLMPGERPRGGEAGSGRMPGEGGMPGDTGGGGAGEMPGEGAARKGDMPD